MPDPIPVIPIHEADGVIDELQAWYLARAERDGLVYTLAIRLLVNQLYLQRQYLTKRKAQGHTTSYDYLVEQQQKAVAWAIQQLVLLVPEDLKAMPEPMKERPKERNRLPKGAMKPKGPSWNGKPKKNWGGPDLPPPGSIKKPKEG
jgi:hypothetical protein